MRKKWIISAYIGCISLATSCLVMLTALSLGWFTGPLARTEDDQTIDGGIDLRGYFYAGTGADSTHAYEIVTCEHFNNLVRLQNLGIFSSKKTYFQIGHDFGAGLKCIDGYDGSGNPHYSDVLDMGAYSLSHTILPIGSEGTPFIGEFDGKNIPIQNLKVKGYPEDIGVFGYVSYEGLVKNLICENLQVESTGYSSDVEDDSHILFSRDVDNLFAQNARYFATARLSLVEGNTVTNLKKLNGAQGTDLADINKPDKMGSNNISNYYLRATYPSGSNKGNFTYSWKSSSSLVKKRGNSNNEMLIDLTSLKESADFNSGISRQSDARISLIASIDIDGYVFSRVIQSYTLEFYSKGHGFYGWTITDSKIIKTGEGAPTSAIGQEGDYYIDKNVSDIGQVNVNDKNLLYYRGSSGWSLISETNVYLGNGAPDWDDFDTYSTADLYVDLATHSLYTRESLKGYYSARAFCEYINPANDAGNTHHYHHGNNIGFLAGHVDGTIENSYLYNGKFIFNNAGASYTSIDTESETGLIGEIGTNVVNSIKPDFGLKQNGDTGVINLSKVYKMIRDVDANGDDHAMAEDDVVMAGKANGTNYISYQNYLNPDSYSRFSQYLRTSASGIQEYITGTSSDMSGGSPEDWHEYTISSVNDDFNSIDFNWNQIIEDERRGFYVDTSSNDLYVKEEYRWSDPLTTGVYTGALAPSNSIGNNGAYYLNTLTEVLFLKTDGVWNKIDALVGSVNTSTSFGKVNELYVQTTNGKVSRRSANSWTQIATATRSSIGPNPEQSSAGNYFIDTVSYKVFKKDETGNWNILQYVYSGSGAPDKSANNSGDRGMGVFKIISAYNDNARIGDDTDHYKYFTQNMGACRIMKGTPKTKVYFSTAEFDHSKGGATWDNEPLRAATLPTYFDAGSFDWKFKRDYNYCFELDLTQMNQAQGQYMYNTKSDFLTHYLYNVLIDKNGAPIEPGTDEFGFMFVSSENESLDSLSSYMPVGTPGTKKNYGTTSNPRYYPANCIAFSIDNDNGANVSVVGNNADITIYQSDPSVSTDPAKMFTMKAKNNNAMDQHRFFPYEVKTGDTGDETVKYGDLFIDTENYDLYKEDIEGDGWTLQTSSNGKGTPAEAAEDGDYYIDKNTNYVYVYHSASSKWEKVYGVLTGTGAPSINNQDMKDSEALYGHIFKLPKGHYVLGSYSGTANIYFLAVQGQTEATLGQTDVASIGNAVSDVDFLTAPVSAGGGFKYAKFTFAAYFNTVSGEYTIGVDDGKFRIVFSDTPNKFLTYLLTYSRTTELTYYIYVVDGEGTIVKSNSYNSSGNNPAVIYRSS